MAGFTVSYATNGSCSSLSRHGDSSGGGGIRSAISTFSKQSRMRAIKLINSIDRKRISTIIYFITLTYPKSFPLFHADCKKHLDIFSKRLFRMYPGSFFFWRMEYQQRGAPHFHILLFFPCNSSTPISEISAFKHWCSLSWYEICDTNDIAHYSAGTNCTRMKSWKGVSHYVSKYFSKVDQNETYKHMSDLPGRYWGIYGRIFMPSDIHVHNISAPVYYAMRRVYKRLFKTRCRKNIYYQGCFGISLFLSDRDVISLLNYFSCLFDIYPEDN